MNNINQWRFPSNNYDKEQGLDTADMETFKRDPISSLAREICQNSIDARRDKDMPVKVEFSLFSVDRETIPGIDRLKEEIDSCRDYWQHSTTIKEELDRMAVSISKHRITCLRISDFNTTGLIGVSKSLENDKPWYLLTKGSGVSLKEGTTGGSKGIGKFSTFVASAFNTVFYSTKTEKGEEGYQGIAKFASTYFKDNPEEKTSGNGYFSSNDKNQPILSHLVLDNKFERKGDEFGTDVYIIGFDYNGDWEKLVITKVLESFMVAIVRNHLEIAVNGQLINSQTIGKFIESNPDLRKKDLKSIIAQYELLTSDNVYSEKFDFQNYGDIELMIKGYSHHEAANAINNCTMVRYPFMKITSFNNLSHIPHSALCIIGNNTLNEYLRKIENPQHTDWETNRIKEKETKKQVEQLIKDLKQKISSEIKKYLLNSDSQSSEIEGASDYLPDKGDGEEGNGELIDTVITSAVKENKKRNQAGQTQSDEKFADEPVTGSDEGDDGEHAREDGASKSKGEADSEGQDNSGDDIILKTSKLSGIKHKFYIINKEEKVYNLFINSPIDEENSFISIYALDDMNKRDKLQIYNVKSETKFENRNGNIYFKLQKDNTYNFNFQTDSKEKFAAEVIFYAIG